MLIEVLLSLPLQPLSGEMITPMKVSDVGSSKTTSGADRKKKTGGKGSEFAEQLKQAATVAEQAAPTEAPAVNAVDSILAIQQAPDAMEERSRGLVRDYGDKLLDSLELLRLDILNGAVPKDKLVGIAHTMRARRQQSDDPKLNEIIDEIELRAEVEIAKLTR